MTIHASAGHGTREHLPAALLFAGALAIPLATDNLFLQDAVIFMLLWAGLAGAWNIAGGFAGQLSLGHAAFFGLGAYTSTLLKLHYGLSPWVGMLCGGALVVVASGFIAFAATRLRGPYFALVTIAFATVMQIVAARWYEFTRGNEGLSIPFDPTLANFMFVDKLPWTVIALSYVVAIYALASWIGRSRFGFQLAGMREDDNAAQALGIDTRWLKVVAIALSAFLTALGGTFYAQYVGFVDPGYVFSLDLSVKFALMCIIGGMGTALGPVLGAVLITALEMVLRAKWGGERSGLYLIVYGVLLIVVVRVMPEGLVAGVPQAWKRWRARHAA
ncbi:MAG: branched-chain amino acid ABC transporter permease [Burkholderiales bacterium]|nr:branched-chain amino acid ABC transporter permease [Burkholderiales bacterium]